MMTHILHFSTMMIHIFIYLCVITRLLHIEILKAIISFTRENFLQSKVEVLPISCEIIENLW